MAGQYIEAMRPASLLDAFAAPLRRLPSQCAVCRGWSRQRLCEACTERYAARRPRCRRCAIGVPAAVPVCGACLTQAPPFDRTIAAVDYAHPWDELVRRFKFDACLDLADVLAQRLLDAVRRSDAPRPDWLLPVPVAAGRLRERGYNQAWELARRVARGLPCATDARLLLRMKDTPHQLALPPGERAANVRGAFALEPRRRAEVAGRGVAVLDDVMTTGATASEIARTLLQAGAHSVQVWVLARTPRDDD
jgi:ComF family protein